MTGYCATFRTKMEPFKFCLSKHVLYFAVVCVGPGIIHLCGGGGGNYADYRRHIKKGKKKLCFYE